MDFMMYDRTDDLFLNMLRNSFILMIVAITLSASDRNDVSIVSIPLFLVVIVLMMFALYWYWLNGGYKLDIIHVMVVILIIINIVLFYIMIQRYV